MYFKERRENFQETNALSITKSSDSFYNWFYLIAFIILIIIILYNIKK